MNRLCYIAYDLETTGLCASTSRIVQLGAISISSSQKFEAFVNPGIKIPAEASAVHGIYDKDVCDAASFPEVMTNFTKFCAEQLNQEDEGLVLVGHNSWSYDDVVLHHESLRHACSLQDLLQKAVKRSVGIWSGDTLRASCQARHSGNLVAENLKLSTLYKHFSDKVLEGAHTALADAEAVAFLLKESKIKDFVKLKIFGTSSSKRARSEPPSSETQKRRCLDEPESS